MMKKVLASFLALVLVLSCVAALADTYEQPILFRGAAWGSAFAEVQSALPKGVEMNELSALSYWYPIEDRMFYTRSSSYKAEIGCQTSTYGHTLKDVTVAGHEVYQIGLVFVYQAGEDGVLIKDADHTSLVYAYYWLRPEDPDAVYADLVNKLTTIYGDIDLHQAATPLNSYEQNLWYGADGTMVSVVREDTQNGSHNIRIMYGYLGADDLVDAAYEALVYEEAQKLANDFSGL